VKEAIAKAVYFFLRSEQSDITKFSLEEAEKSKQKKKTKQKRGKN